MSAKTKIVVVHMKELIYSAVFLFLGILLIVLLVCMFCTGGDGDAKETMAYSPGVYTAPITFQNSCMDMEVIVDEEGIRAINLRNLDDSVATMYPLMEPALEDITEQVIANQSTDNITYSAEKQYTSMVLLHAIDEALAQSKNNVE